MSSEIPFIFRRRYEAIIHVILWLYIFLSPMLFKPSDRFFEILEPHQLILPLCWCIVFYINYFWLIPAYFQKGKYTKYFILSIIVLFIFLMVRPMIEMCLPHLVPAPPSEKGKDLMDNSIIGAFELKRLLHDFFKMVLFICAALLARVVRKWRSVETDLQKAKFQKTEAEIKNLKYQINPHFLLNVLNSIYALIAIDTEKAQAAVQELSKMMRYLLSNFDVPTIPLKQEMEFIETYVNLMRLRITNKVDLQYNVDVPTNNNMEIAPMILISLVENAFKHGISPMDKSFIHIYILARNNKLHFSCINSFFPKDADDKTPSGVGLKLVEKRLELSYPGNYTFENQLSGDGKAYSSIIEINLANEQS